MLRACFVIAFGGEKCQQKGAFPTQRVTAKHVLKRGKESDFPPSLIPSIFDLAVKVAEFCPV